MPPCSHQIHPIVSASSPLIFSITLTLLTYPAALLAQPPRPDYKSGYAAAPTGALDALGQRYPASALLYAPQPPAVYYHPPVYPQAISGTAPAVAVVGTMQSAPSNAAVNVINSLTDGVPTATLQRPQQVSHLPQLESRPAFGQPLPAMLYGRADSATVNAANLINSFTAGPSRSALQPPQPVIQQPQVTENRPIVAQQLPTISSGIGDNNKATVFNDQSLGIPTPFRGQYHHQTATAQSNGVNLINSFAVGAPPSALQQLQPVMQQPQVTENRPVVAQQLPAIFYYGDVGRGGNKAVGPQPSAVHIPMPIIRPLSSSLLSQPYQQSQQPPTGLLPMRSTQVVEAASPKGQIHPLLAIAASILQTPIVPSSPPPPPQLQASLPVTPGSIPRVVGNANLPRLTPPPATNFIIRPPSLAPQRQLQPPLRGISGQGSPHFSGHPVNGRTTALTTKLPNGNPWSPLRDSHLRMPPPVVSGPIKKDVAESTTERALISGGGDDGDLLAVDGESTGIAVFVGRNSPHNEEKNRHRAFTAETPHRPSSPIPANYPSLPQQARPGPPLPQQRQATTSKGDSVKHDVKATLTPTATIVNHPQQRSKGTESATDRALISGGVGGDVDLLAVDGDSDAIAVFVGRDGPPRARRPQASIHSSQGEPLNGTNAGSQTQQALPGHAAIAHSAHRQPQSTNSSTPLAPQRPRPLHLPQRARFTTSSWIERRIVGSAKVADPIVPSSVPVPAQTTAVRVPQLESAGALVLWKGGLAVAAQVSPSTIEVPPATAPSESGNELGDELADIDVRADSSTGLTLSVQASTFPTLLPVWRISSATPPAPRVIMNLPSMSEGYMARKVETVVAASTTSIPPPAAFAAGRNYQPPAIHRNATSSPSSDPKSNLTQLRQPQRQLPFGSALVLDALEKPAIGANGSSLDKYMRPTQPSQPTQPRKPYSHSPLASALTLGMSERPAEWPKINPSAGHNNATKHRQTHYPTLPLVGLEKPIEAANITVPAGHKVATTGAANEIQALAQVLAQSRQLLRNATKAMNGVKNGGSPPLRHRLQELSRMVSAMEGRLIAATAKNEERATTTTPKYEADTQTPVHQQRQPQRTTANRSTQTVRPIALQRNHSDRRQSLIEILRSAMKEKYGDAMTAEKETSSTTTPDQASSRAKAHTSDGLAALEAQSRTSPISWRSGAGVRVPLPVAAIGRYPALQKSLPHFQLLPSPLGTTGQPNPKAFGEANRLRFSPIDVQHPSIANPAGRNLSSVAKACAGVGTSKSNFATFPPQAGSPMTNRMSLVTPGTNFDRTLQQVPHFRLTFPVGYPGGTHTTTHYLHPPERQTTPASVIMATERGGLTAAGSESKTNPRSKQRAYLAQSNFPPPRRLIFTASLPVMGKIHASYNASSQGYLPSSGANDRNQT